jgi:hypothetical protein
LEQRRAARDGMRIFVSGKLPENRSSKSTFKPEELKLVAEKLDKITDRCYVMDGFIINFLDYFAVPKGLFDIRIVYDGTKCGLNDALWAQNFYLPDGTVAGWLLTYTTYCVDVDFGEMFLNFFMDEALQPYAGIYTLPVRDYLKRQSTSERLATWKRWNRLFMGMTPSPYCAVRFYYWMEELGL